MQTMVHSFTALVVRDVVIRFNSFVPSATEPAARGKDAVVDERNSTKGAIRLAVCFAFVITCSKTFLTSHTIFRGIDVQETAQNATQSISKTNGK